MIRFINLGFQCCPDPECHEEFDLPSFAFMSTVTNTFIALNEEMIWDNEQELTVDWQRESGYRPDLQRFLSLIPEGWERDG